MGFEAVYSKLGVVIIEHALDDDRDMAEIDRAFGPRTSASPLTEFHRSFGETADAATAQTAPITALPADLTDWLETHPVFINLATRLLAAPAQLVRIEAVDETKPAHWLAPYRQMRQIAVHDRHRVAGFRNWTLRNETWLVEPPSWVLEQSVVLRIYLDNCSAFDGPFEVLTSTHEEGRMKRVEISDAAKSKRALTCLCDRGDILALSPLALRRRHRANRSAQRRVMELTFSAAALPLPLMWPSLLPEIERSAADVG